MEGVILNKKSLCQEFASTNFKDLVLNLFKQKNNIFCAFEGEFSGSLLIKVKKQCLLLPMLLLQKVFIIVQKI